MEIVGKISDWQLAAKRPGYERWMRHNPATDEIEINELWFNERPLKEAAIERELANNRRGDFTPLCVIPNSERARAIREGWEADDGAWRRWMNDIDNRYLRITTGAV